MTLGHLRVDSVRNIKSANLELSPTFNFFIGGNGSGKTSLLESIYLLSTGRSFRGPGAGSLVNHDFAACTVNGQIRLRKKGREVSVGVTRERKNFRSIHINGQPNQHASQLAQLLPTICLGPQSIDLVIGSPELRRRFLNWGVFHVEPSFNSVWLDAQHSLKQRNSLLRNKRMSAAELDSWTEQFVALANKVTQFRDLYFEQFLQTYQRIAKELLAFESAELEFYPGWSSHSCLKDLLEIDREKEIQRGHSLWGHQRADIRITTRGKSANSVFSRGELKLIAWTMLISQGVLLSQSGLRNTLFLVDDLTAELDRDNGKNVCEVLRQAASQVCLTGLEHSIVDDFADQDSKLFHVEQGEFMQKEIVS